MYSRLLSTLCGLLATSGAFAQGVPLASPAVAPATTKVPRGNSSLSGTVVDAITKKPVEYATVALLPEVGEQPLVGMAADEKGRFVFKSLAPGAYRISVSFVGYTARTLPVTLTEKDTDLGALELTGATKQLNGVTITGEREMVENKPDRLVYNAERDATNTGGTATDVLRKTPLLNVDADGNVQLRGSSNLRVLINNKPSALLAGNLTEALKQIPADQIKAVEVITAPSAKYDGEGSGGVINIVLKKNNLQGVNGNVGGGLGNRNQSGNASLNVRKGKVGFNGNLSLYSNQYPSRSQSTRTDFLSDGQIGQLEQRTSAKSTGNGRYGQIGLSYDPTPEHSFTLTVNNNSYLNQQPQRLFNQYTGGGAPRDTLYTRANDQRNESQNYDVSGGYTRTFAKQPNREWSVLAQHSRSRGTQRYTLDQYHAAEIEQGPVEYREQSRNLSVNRETTLQTDYVHPLKEKHTLETGLKAIMRGVGSDYSIDTLLVRRQDDFARSIRRSNAFDYQQNVLSGYGTYRFALGKKYSFSLGTRLEHTRIEGAFMGENGQFANQYTNLLPSLSATRNLKKPGQSLRASYSRRIQRPNIYYLNPFVRQTDPRNIFYGNPELNPEVTDNYELTYGTFGKTGSLNVSLYTRRTNNAIENVSFYNEERARAETTYRNIASNNSYGLNLYGSIKPKPKWQIGTNLNANYVRLRSVALNRRTERLVVNGGLNSSLRFGKNYTAQFYGGFWSGSVQLQSRYSGGGYYSLSLKRSFLKEKLDVTVNASNFLRDYRVFTYRTATPQFETAGTSYNYQRTVRLSASYRFGKIDTKPSRSRRSIRNDDQKGSGDSQSGG
jgi:outer membrane receptor protein involved in Fe transport